MYESSFIGLMIISKENALFIGTSFFVSAGIAFNTLKFIKRIYDDWQPNRSNRKLLK
jgi:hypothetical protein